MLYAVELAASTISPTSTPLAFAKWMALSLLVATCIHIAVSFAFAYICKRPCPKIESAKLIQIISLFASILNILARPLLSILKSVSPEPSLNTAELASILNTSLPTPLAVNINLLALWEYCITPSLLSPLSPKTILPRLDAPDKIERPVCPLPSITNSSAVSSTEAPLSAVLICKPTPKSFAAPTPAVANWAAPLPTTVVAVIAWPAIVLPDCAVNVFAVNWKSSAPAILTSIWSSVSAVMLVSPSASRINSVPFMSILEPVCTSNVFALNAKSSAPAILISIWSSVSAVMLVSPSTSKISSSPLISLFIGPPTAPDISIINIEAPLAGAVVNVICVPLEAKV